MRNEETSEELRTSTTAAALELAAKATSADVVPRATEDGSEHPAGRMVTAGKPAVRRQQKKVGR